MGMARVPEQRLRRRCFLVLAGTAAGGAILAACGGGTATDTPKAAAPTTAAPTSASSAASTAASGTTASGSAASGVATVRITAPVEGATVAGPDIAVTYAASGVTIAAADSKDTPGVAHYHVILDDAIVPGQPLPKDDTHIHTTDTTTVLKGVKPGKHTIRVALANGLHVPLSNPQAQAAATITVT